MSFYASIYHIKKAKVTHYEGRNWIVLIDAKDDEMITIHCKNETEADELGAVFNKPEAIPQTPVEDDEIPF